MTLKRTLRKHLPLAWQVPLKYQYNRLRGFLEPELKFLGLWVQRGDKVIDIGANLGVYTLQLHALDARVEAFEPNTACAAVLEAWALKRKHISIHRYGLSDAEGEFSLNIPVDEGGVAHSASASLEAGKFASSVVERVQVRTLDSFEFKEVGFIKIDVEGHELHVLRGGERTLRENEPVLQVEIEQRHQSVSIDVVFGWITGLGYSGYFFNGGRFRPLATFDARKHQIPQPARGNRVEYVNNFIFVPTARLGEARFDAFRSRIASE